jgi:AcrR family transcriptional regulator
MLASQTKPAQTTIVRDRGNARGRATRELLILTAERLFAEQGINAVSLREIAIAADQRNNAAIEYHFGSRENLLAAIYAYRAETVNLRCLELIRDITSEGRLDDVSALLRSLLAPHIENLHDPSNHFVRFLARALTEEARLNIVASNPIKPQLDAVMMIRSHIRRCLPGLSDERFEARISTVINWAVHKLAEFSRDSADAGADRIEDMVDDLVEMVEAALRASKGAGLSS